MSRVGPVVRLCLSSGSEGNSRGAKGDGGSGTSYWLKCGVMPYYNRWSGCAWLPNSRLEGYGRESPAVG